MKTAIVAIITALAASAVASPVASPDSYGCTPGAYMCANNPKTGCSGISNCDTQGKWQYIGDCPIPWVCGWVPGVYTAPYCLPPH
jgi:hypothetical protein